MKNLSNPTSAPLPPRDLSNVIAHCGILQYAINVGLLAHVCCSVTELFQHRY